MRRTAVSIPSNIAEGAARNSKPEFAHFLNIAIGSLSELETQITIARRQYYIPDVTELLELAGKISSQLSGPAKILIIDYQLPAFTHPASTDSRRFRHPSREGTDKG